MTFSPAPAPLSPFPAPVRKVGAPIGVVMALGIVTGLLVLLMTAARPVSTSIGFLASSLVMGVVVLAYLWLDRWEPEPPRLLIMAFMWGSSVAVILALVLEALGASMFAEYTDAPLLWQKFIAAAVGAPFIEEAAKGLFLVLMMTGRRRDELNSLTDCMVYAGITATGFAWLENIEYIANADSPAATAMVAMLRLVIAPFAHPLFTTMTGIGVYAALRLRNPVGKVAAVTGGYLVATGLHAMWNGSLLLGPRTYLLVYVGLMLPILVIVIAIGVRSRGNEQRVVAGKLPGMVAAGLITPNEATWLGSLRTRKAAVREASRLGGRTAGRQVSRFAATVVELAFVRDRIDDGCTTPRMLSLLNEGVQAVSAARWAAPALSWLATYRAWGPWA